MLIYLLRKGVITVETVNRKYMKIVVDAEALRVEMFLAKHEGIFFESQFDHDKFYTLYHAVNNFLVSK